MEYNSFTDSFSEGSGSMPTGLSNLTPDHLRGHIRAEVGTGGGEVSYYTDASGQLQTSCSQSQGGWIGAEDLISCEGVEATIRSASGFPVLNRGYYASDTIDIGGISGVSMAIAASLGYAVRNPDGTYSVATSQGAQGGAPEGQPEVEPEETAVFTATPDAENAMEILTQHVSAGSQMAAFEQMLANDGAISADTLSRMASEAGAEPHEVAAIISTVYDGFQSAVMDRLAGRGVNDGDLFEDFLKSDPRRMQEAAQAARALMLTNDPTGFDNLARAYVESVDQIDPDAVAEALAASGISHSRTGNGEFLLTIPGAGQMTYKQALRAGIITVSRR